MGQKIDDFPNLKRWQDAIKARPATQRAYDKAKQFQNLPPTSPEARNILFGQDAGTVRRAGA
jgi:GST-like protein